MLRIAGYSLQNSGQSRLSQAAALLLGVFVLSGCQLAGKPPNGPAVTTPAALQEAGEVAAANSLPVGALALSPPSVPFSELLTFARAQLSPEQSNSLLYSISAEPYDYSFAYDYVPTHEVLRVRFGFLDADLNYIDVQMPDDAPKAALRVDSWSYAREGSGEDDVEEEEEWRETYSDTLKLHQQTNDSLAAANISPRDAISLTRPDATKHAGKLDLAETISPRVEFVAAQDAGAYWEVTWSSNTSDLSQPLATYRVSPLDGTIVAQAYADAAESAVPTAILEQSGFVEPAPTSTPNALVTAQDYYEAAQVADDWDETLKLYSEAIKLDPSYVDPYHGRIEFYEDAGEYDLAIADYTTLLEIDPGNAATIYYYRGHAYFAKSNAGDCSASVDKAIADFKQAIELDPDYLDAHLSLGDVSKCKGDYSQALKSYARVLEIDAEYATAYFQRGMVYESKEDWAKAINEFNKYIALVPDDAQGYVERGLSDYHLGNYKSAIADLTQGIRLDGTHYAAYRLRGFSHSGRKEYEAALRDFNTALELNSEDVFAYSGRANLYWQTGQYERVPDDLRPVLAEYPDDSDARNLRGWSYLYQDEHDLAIEDFTTVLKSTPDNVWAYTGRAWSY
ncbi:MAG: tetratricopeptide repeat protein [Chloroflexota bacterium]|nr:tetratricopeptide repeat protein [Chloroflexota bacterium]